nr:putative MerR2 protein [Klebsiella sp. LS13-39]
MAGASTA